MSDDAIESFTAQEQCAIRALQRLARRWPKSIMLLADGSLRVVRCDDYSSGRIDGSGGEGFASAWIDGIPCDGGDPW